MGKIRLQIQILPWENLTFNTPLRPQARQDDVRPWTQPEPAENSLQQLVDNITTRYGRIYVGRGALRVKELQDAWGGTLDLSDRVGDIFNDRSSSGDILTSICKVLRYPPEPAEVQNLYRFASLLPESSARPQKRSLPPLFDAGQQPVPSVEKEGAEASIGHVSSTHKRRKTHDVRTPTRGVNSDSLYYQQGRDGSVQRPASRTHVSHLVKNSPDPPLRNGNANGTSNPSSNRADRAIPPNAIQIIPDSPSDGRVTTTNVDRESTKSESPELRLSVHEVAPLEIEFGRRSKTAEVTDLSVVNEDAADVGGEAGLPQLQADRGDSPHAFSRKPDYSVPSAGLGRSHSGARTFSPAMVGHDSDKTPQARRNGTDVFDPIESDTESFHERQQMSSSKLLRLSKTSSDRASLPRLRREGSGSRRSEFKIPALPKKIIDRIANPAGQVPSLGTNPDKHRNLFQEVVTAAGEGNGEAADREAKSLVNGSSVPRHHHSFAAQSEASGSHKEPSLSAQPDKTRPFPMEGQAATGSFHDEGSSYQSSQASNEQKMMEPCIQVAEEEGVQGLPAREARPREQRHGSTSTAEVDDQASSWPQADGEGKSADTDQKQGMKETLSADSLEHKSVGQCEDILTAQDIDRQDTGGLRSLELDDNASGGYQLRKLRARKNASTDAAQPDIEYPQGSRTKALKEQQLRDQAERMNLAADGAKQLEIEKKSKQSMNTPKANGWIGAKGEALKNPPRTEAQKEARRQRERKKREEKAAAERFRERTFGSTASNASVRSSQGSERGGQASMDGNEGAIQLSARLGGNSEAESFNSNADSTPGPGRRTLTPLIPGSASSNQNRGPSPMSSKSFNSNGGPLRSAMKQPVNSLRRSASQVSFGGSLSAGHKGDSSNNADVTPSKPEKRGYISNPAISTATSSIKSTLPQKKQATLNVNIDRKMKGRVVDPPSPIQALLQENAHASSESEESVSSYISEEDGGLGSLKAGPSIKQAAKSGPKAVAEVDQPSSSIDPALRSLSQRSANASRPISAPHSELPSLSETQRGAIKSSPSQASGAITISSGSSSDFESSDSESVKGLTQPTLPFGLKNAVSSSNNITAPSQSSEEPSLSSSNSERVTGGAVLAAANGSASSRSSAVSTTSSKSSNKSSTGKTPAVTMPPTSAHNPHISQASSEQYTNASVTNPSENASKQLHQETQDSLQSSQKSKPAPQGNPPLKSLRTGNFRYPSLSQLKREAEGKSELRASRLADGLSRLKNQTLDALDLSSDSDDDSESSSSVSTDPKIATKSNSGLIPGMKGLLKLAKGRDVGKKKPL